MEKVCDKPSDVDALSALDVVTAKLKEDAQQAIIKASESAGVQYHTCDIEFVQNGDDFVNNVYSVVFTNFR